MDEQLLSALKKQVIPVLDIRDPERAAPLARVLLEAGVPAVEVTLRSARAWEGLDRMRDAVPELIVGVGSVLSEEQLQQAASRQLAFAVSPGLSELLVRCAQDSKLCFIPGVATPSEVLNARLLGVRLAKLFPAELLGGVAMLKALSGPLPDMRFFPTGGVSVDTYRDYLMQDNVHCTGATWLAPPADIAAGNWAAIAERARRIYRG